MIFSPFPFEDLEINTKLPKEEVMRRIRNITGVSESKSGLLASWDTSSHPRRYFYGSVGMKGFTIRRDTGSKNNIHPIIEGEVRSHVFGTAISVHLRMEIPALILLVLLCGGGVGLGLAELLTSGFNETAVGAFGFAVACYVAFVALYIITSFPAKKMLVEITEGKLVDQGS